MLKNLLLFLICTTLVLAQNRFEIEFKPLNNYTINNDELDYFEFTEFDSHGYYKIPKNYFNLAIPQNSTIKLEVIKTDFIKFQNKKLSVNKKLVLINDSDYVEHEVPLRNNIANEPLFEIIDYKFIKDVYCAVIKINPLIINNESISQLVTIRFNVTILSDNIDNSEKELTVDDEIFYKEIILNYNDVKKYITNRISPVYSKNNIPFKSFVKIKIDKDALYRIDYNTLIEYGLNPDLISPSKIKLYNKGIEIPVYVKDNSSLSFNRDNYVEFYGVKNYDSVDYKSIVNRGEEYRNYMDRYSDTSIYILSYEGSDGLRIPINANYQNSEDTLNYGIEKIHIEKDNRLWFYDVLSARTQLPFWQEHKVWTMDVVGNGSNVNYTFNASNIVPNEGFNAVVRLLSYSANSNNGIHEFSLNLNSGISDSIRFNYRETADLSISRSSNLLLNGRNNLVLSGYNTNTEFQQALVDWIDVEYPKFNFAENDSLMFIAPDVETKIYNISVSNFFDTNIVLYKVSGECRKINNFQLNNNVLLFSDIVSSGDKYVIIKESSVCKPVLSEKSEIKDISISEGVEYLIITNKELQKSAALYETFIQDKYNLKTLVAFTDNIYDEYSNSYMNPHAIKKYIKHIYDNGEKKLKNVLLLGDANYDYKKSNNFIRKNLVPSYGFPNSDSWYAVFDDSSLIQSISIGRVPAAYDEEVINYLKKHQNYISRKYDNWNKNYLLFSGGNPSTQYELEQIYSVNNNLINDLINEKPIKGNATHFYKTLNPASNMGPYSLEDIKNSINGSGIFYSYIGHSGTRTWDNGIIEVENLQSSYADRHPLITDFGCSTGKFAEPDVDSFAEYFISKSKNGQAISYIGNSSLGFFNISMLFPKLFYSLLLKDQVTNIGSLHSLAKASLISQYGLSEVNKVFLYCNSLIGDPIINLAIPKKENYKFNGIVSLQNNFNDQSDSVELNLSIENTGLQLTDSIWVEVKQTYLDSIIMYYSKTINLDNNSFNIWVKTKNLSGAHKILLRIDQFNVIDEIYEDDNEFVYNYYVPNSSIRAIEPEYYYSSRKDTLKVLLPHDAKIDENIRMEIADNESFSNSVIIEDKIKSSVSYFILPDLQYNKRYWWKVMYKSISTTPISFLNIRSDNSIWFQDDDQKNRFRFNNTIYDTATKSFKLSSRNNELIITSAGSLDGRYCSVKYNGNEVLLNTFIWGISTAELDSVTLEPSNIKNFIFPPEKSADSLIKYIGSLPVGQKILLVVSDDAAQSVIGYSAPNKAREAIKLLGSSKIDSVKYRDSWCMIGGKGVSDVQEVYTPSSKGKAVISKTSNSYFSKGSIEFPLITNSSSWETINTNYLLPENSSSHITVLNKTNETVLEMPIADKLDIKDIKETELKVKIDINANSNGTTPEIKSLGLSYTSLPELLFDQLGTFIISDSLINGDTLDLRYSILNSGYKKVEKYFVRGSLVNPEGNVAQLFSEQNQNLNYNSKMMGSFSLPISYNFKEGSYKVRLSIDSVENEFFKDNNYTELSFSINEDTLKSINLSSLKTTFDGRDIIDGDYIAPLSNIEISYAKPKWFNENSRNNFLIRIDNEDIDTNIIQMDYSQNLIAKYNFKKKIDEGEHTLSIFLRNAYGFLPTEPQLTRRFFISNQLSVKDVYNYPNPFMNNTNFVFTLPNIPDELKIVVYTIAGRTIRNILVNSSALQSGFNSLAWDGKDEDGHEVANGTYLYKLIITKDNKSEYIIQKLSKVK